MQGEWLGGLVQPNGMAGAVGIAKACDRLTENLDLARRCLQRTPLGIIPKGLEQHSIVCRVIHFEDALAPELLKIRQLDGKASGTWSRLFIQQAQPLPGVTALSKH